MNNFTKVSGFVVLAVVGLWLSGGGYERLEHDEPQVYKAIEYAIELQLEGVNVTY